VGWPKMAAGRILSGGEGRGVWGEARERLRERTSRSQKLPSTTTVLGDQALTR